MKPCESVFCLTVIATSVLDGNGRYDIGIMVLWIALMLLGQSTLAGKAAGTFMVFGDFPAARPFHGVPATPILQTAGQKLFRTRIREATRKGPNFAGHYTIAEWGCGSSCISVAVIDAETGAVYEGPFGRLPTALLSYNGSLQYRGPKGEYQDEGLSYRLTSRLLIARGCPNDANCATYFYEWTGSQFKLLRKLPATPEPR